MNKKLLKIAILGKTNAGKSTLINLLVGEKISIINKKINTTLEFIIGVKNINNSQIIFYDTPGSNLLKTTNINQKNLKTNIWQAINEVDLLVYIIDISNYKYKYVESDILKLSEVNKSIVIIFNKIDLIEKENFLPIINELKNISHLKDFFLISAKFNKGIKLFYEYLTSKSYNSKWIYNNNEITNKDDVFITNECTRNSILKFLHKEIPYNLCVKNILFKYLKNNNLKIKQVIELKNIRHKPIILGKNGVTIKKIREQSQKDIQEIFNIKTHLYLRIDINNDK